MDGSATVVMMSRQHGDRWLSWSSRPGVNSVSSLLQPDELRRIEALAELDAEFLRELAPDMAITTWATDATIFEQGTYLDVAFIVIEGEVELYLAANAQVALPIFAVQGDAGTSVPEVVRLASMDFDLTAGERIALGAGEMFGEIGAMNGWPQSATARTKRACRLLQIRLPALRKLRRKSKRLKQRMDELYRSRTLRQHLASTPLLQGCDRQVIQSLAQHVELVSCQPGDVVTSEGDAVTDVILVRSGALKLTQTVGRAALVVGYAGKGETIGESELLVDEGSAWQTSATSTGYSELVRIPRDRVLEVLRSHPALEQRLWASAMARISDIGAARTNLRRSDVLDFTIAKGVAQANSVLVIDLEKCTRCDDCVRGCASTHGGVPRFVREGEVYDGFMVARSCYHCQDPLCMVGCPTGAIRRINVGAVVEIDPAVCIGCGACAENCVYDAIVMHDLGTVWGADAVPKHLRGQPRSLASKCDLCRTAPQGPACVSSCPHGAASRISSAAEFDILLQARRLAARGA